MTYEPTGLAAQIFASRHAAHPTETWLEACDRVAAHVSNAEEGEARATWRDNFRGVLADNLLMPGGRIWYGSGRARGQLLNCFVVPTHDSREGWAKTMGDTLIISGTGGGVGCNYSPTRPRGSAIRGAGGTATGAVSEMEIVNGMGNVLKAGGGRRIALMMALSANHGDIVEFLDKKLDLKQLNNANVSVIFDQDPEAFFDLVRCGGQWPLIFQGREVGSIPAALLWDRIVTNALIGGEPGLLNGYLANRMSNIWYIEELTCTNPCFAPGTRISTDQGMLRIEDMAQASRTANVLADRRVQKGDRIGYDEGVCVLPAVDVELKQRNAQVFKLTTEHGYTVTATAEHLFVTAVGRKKLANIVAGDVLLLPSGEGSFGPSRGTRDFNEGFVLGLHVSDGTKTTQEAFVDIWSADFADADLIQHIVNNVAADEPTHGNGDHDYGVMQWTSTGDVKKRIGGRRVHRWLAGLADGERIEMLKERVPESVWRGSRDYTRGYIIGLFYGDGSLNVAGHELKETVSLRLAQSHLPLLEDVQRLLTSFGIVCRLYLRRVAGVRMMPDGHGGSAEYQHKDQYELVINRPNLINFRTRVGMLGRKAVAIDEALAERGTDCRRPERFITRVTGVERAGITDVYCLTQPETNSVISDGIVNGQCGEIWLSPYDCCCLGSLVLPRFLIDRRDGTQAMNWELLKETTATGVRFLDDVLSVNQYPLTEIKEKCSQLRRIGLGIMGLHHLLLELGFQYNSPEGLEFVDRLMKFIKNAAYEASSDLAVEKGSFPAFVSDKFLRGQFVKTLRPTLRSKIGRQGMRNCAVLTIAPTGTIAMVSGVSSGIEPIYAAGYERRFRDGDELKTEIVIDPMFQRFVDEGRDVTHFQGAHDLKIRDHMEMQRVCQRHVDNAVSKTINLPHGTTPAELSDLYMEFFPDLKGVTVYPDGSREDQPLTGLPVSRALNIAREQSAAVGMQEARCAGGSCDL